MIKTKKKNILIKSVIYIAMAAASFSFLYPIIYMLINSLKTRAEYYTNSFSLPQGELQFINYYTMISQFKILRLFLNSFTLIIIAGTLVIIVSVFASYAFAKLEFKWRNVIYIAILATTAIPAQVTIIPMYVFFAKGGLINNIWSVIFAYLGTYTASNILLMTSFFKGISNEMLEAGRIDGCGYFQTVKNIVLPMGIPAIIMNVIFNAIYMWNDLFTPLIFLTKDNVKTVMAALTSLVMNYIKDPPYQLAGLLLSAIPCMVIYLFAQKYIIKGFTVGSYK